MFAHTDISDLPNSVIAAHLRLKHTCFVVSQHVTSSSDHLHSREGGNRKALLSFFFLSCVLKTTRSWTEAPSTAAALVPVVLRGNFFSSSP